MVLRRRIYRYHRPSILDPQLFCNQNYSFMYKIEKFDCNAFVVFLNTLHLTHSEFSIFGFTVLRWAVKPMNNSKKFVKMWSYVTFDPIVPLQVMAYLDQIYRKLCLENSWTHVYSICIPRIGKCIVLYWFEKYWHFVFENVYKVSVEKGLNN
jgi:hypothetical protein